MDKYKLVIFGDTWDVYQTAYQELIENPKVVYIPTFRPKGFKGLLQRIQFNPKLNAVIKIPGKQRWNPCYLRQVKEEKVCFLVMNHWLRMESGIQLFPFLRSHYPESRIVCFTQDLMETIIDHYTHRPFDVQHVKKYVDLFISYDPNDAQRHQVEYHPTVFSTVTMDANEETDGYDLYFLGRDKGRMRTLVAIAQEAKRRGLKCKFIMLQVPDTKKVECEGIEYVDAPLSYKENLRNGMKSKCIIEMLQKKAASPTFRTWETISSNKKLLTDNVSIRETEWYDERYISVFNDETNIDWDFIASEQPFPQGNPYQARIRPESLVRFMEDKLNIQIDRA